MRYSLDDATFADLSAWCDNTLRRDEVTNVRDRMAEKLEGATVEDATRWLVAGYWHLYGLL